MCPEEEENSGGDVFVPSVTVNEIAVIRSDTKRKREKNKLGHCHAFTSLCQRGGRAAGRYLIDMEEGWPSHERGLGGLV